MLFTKTAKAAKAQRSFEHMSMELSLINGFACFTKVGI